MLYNDCGDQKIYSYVLCLCASYDSPLKDSLHGDLDIETQLRIMESLSHDQSRTSSTTPPPPYSSVVPNPFAPLLEAAESDTRDQGAAVGGGAEGRSHKRQPCVYFLSGYCRKGTECPDYHGMDPEDMDDLEVRKNFTPAKKKHKKT